MILLFIVRVLFFHLFGYRFGCSQSCLLKINEIILGDEEIVNESSSKFEVFSLMRDNFSSKKNVFKPLNYLFLIKKTRSFIFLTIYVCLERTSKLCDRYSSFDLHDQIIVRSLVIKFISFHLSFALVPNKITRFFYALSNLKPIGLYCSALISIQTKRTIGAQCLNKT